MTPARAAVAALHRYPVKSMLGEHLTAADVTDRGITGDRALALLDTATGRIASAKHPRLWQRLLTLTATTPDQPRPHPAHHQHPGRSLHIGPDLVLRVLVTTPRCAVPTLTHGDLPHDTDALRVLADHHRITPLPALGPQPCAGVYAQVLHPGRIHPGDPVRY